MLSQEAEKKGGLWKFFTQKLQHISQKFFFPFKDCI